MKSEKTSNNKPASSRQTFRQRQIICQLIMS